MTKTTEIKLVITIARSECLPEALCDFVSAGSQPWAARRLAEPSTACARISDIEPLPRSSSDVGLRPCIGGGQCIELMRSTTAAEDASDDLIVSRHSHADDAVTT